MPFSYPKLLGFFNQLFNINLNNKQQKKGGELVNMDIVSWVIFGLIVGIIANIIDPRPSSGGILGAIVLGIVGALLGGFLGNLLFGVGVTGFNFSSFIVAILGSLLLLFISRALVRR